MFRKALTLAALVAMMAAAAEAQTILVPTGRYVGPKYVAYSLPRPHGLYRSHSYYRGSRYSLSLGASWGSSAAPAPAYAASGYAPASVRQETNTYINVRGSNNNVNIGGGGSSAPAQAAPGGYYRGQYLGPNAKGKLDYDIPLPDGAEVEVEDGYVTDPHDD